MNPQKKSALWKIVLGIVVVLLGLAILIPNLLRSRMTGDPPYPGATSTVRTLNTAEVTYLTTYPKIGYAPNLAVLGSDVADYGQCRPTPEHACLIDVRTACPTGIGKAWCVNGPYRYNIQTSSSEPPYKDYWITATPVQANPEFKNYCSLSDAVLRYEKAAPLSRPYTREECESLPPLAN